jgi:hypothetical protein
MNVNSKLRNNLIRKIQKLSIDKLAEVTSLLSKVENQFKSKENTIKLAGAWKNIENDWLSDFTENLHSNRAKDRQID